MVNYFELYGFHVMSFHPDTVKVKTRFYELSKQFHPDRFTQLGPEAMDEALKMSALNNEAYKILKDPYATMKYILRYHELLEEEEKYNLPADFLLEMMELNELVSECEMEPDQNKKQEAVGSWQLQMNALESELGPLTNRYDDGDHSPELLQQIKELYFKKKYLLRIQERITKFAAS